MRPRTASGGAHRHAGVAGRIPGGGTVARGDVSGCEIPFWKLIARGKALRAAGFILVHNHPSGDPTPSLSDIRTTRRLARVSHELDVRLLDHLIVAGDQLKEVGEWGWGGVE